MATKNNLNIVVTPSATSLFVGTISRGTGTYTAAGIKLVFGFVI